MRNCVFGAFALAAVLFLDSKNALAHRGIFDRVEELYLSGEMAVLEVMEYIYTYEPIYDRMRQLIDSNGDGKITQDEADRYAKSRATSVLSGITVSMGETHIRFVHKDSRADMFPPDFHRNYMIVLWHRFETRLKELKCSPLTFVDLGHYRRAAVRIKWDNFCSVKNGKKLLKRGMHSTVFEGKEKNTTLNFVEE